MPKENEIIELIPDQRIRETKAPATSVQLPLAVHRRLDVLAQLADNVAASRKEIIGMLIADADLDRETLQGKIVAYRGKTNAQVIPDVLEEPSTGGDGKLLRFEKRGRGRPRQEAS